jgi:hypothetical protein
MNDTFENDEIVENDEVETVVERTRSTGAAAPNTTMLILLGVIVVLLVALIVVIFTGTGGSKTAETPGLNPTNGQTTTGGQTGMGGTTGTETAFDPATATKVAASVTPEDHVKQYFDAVVAGDYATAFALLPKGKQDEYGSQEAFAKQLTGYAVQGYTIDDSTEADGEAQVTATATMEGGSFQYLWTFVKDGDTWLVKSRALPGMGN